MKRASDLEPVALEEILKLKRNGVSREDAFAAARLIFQLKQRLIEAGLKRNRKR
jgi:hypothetical protein